MFDLFRSRDKAVRIMLGVILGVVALSMVTYLIPGGWMNGGDSSSNSNVVATIGDMTVTAPDAGSAFAPSILTTPALAVPFVSPMVNPPVKPFWSLE